MEARSRAKKQVFGHEKLVKEKSDTRRIWNIMLSISQDATQKHAIRLECFYCRPFAASSTIVLCVFPPHFGCRTRTAASTDRCFCYPLRSERPREMNYSGGTTGGAPLAGSPP